MDPILLHYLLHVFYLPFLASFYAHTLYCQLELRIDTWGKYCGHVTRATNSLYGKCDYMRVDGIPLHMYQGK
jgi:hypothetical protein